MTTAAASRTEIIPLESQRAAAAALARAIRGRHTYLALTGECDVGKSIVLDAALAAVADEALRLIMVGNPRAGPLTLSGVLQQIAQYAPPPSPDAEEGDVERIHAMLQAADRKRIVIVVEDAETLKPKALTFLQFLPELAGLTAGGLQIVLVGSPGLWRLMESESSRPDARAARGPGRRRAARRCGGPVLRRMALSRAPGPLRAGRHGRGGCGSPRPARPWAAGPDRRAGRAGGASGAVARRRRCGPGRRSG